MNNEFNPIQNEIAMSGEEQKTHKSLFSKLCLAFVAYLAFSQAFVILASLAIKEINPELLKNGNFSILLSSAIQYLVAFPIFILIIKKIPANAPTKNTLNIKNFIKLLSISMLVMYIGEYLSNMVMLFINEQLGTVPENAVNSLLSSTDIWLSALIVGIIAPIVEELMFRKFIIDRLTPYGDVLCIFFPALIFGLIHGNLYQFFYAFFIGIILSFVYVKTGKIIYSIIIHCFINLFCGVLLSYINTLVNIEELYEMLYSGALTEEYYAANQAAINLLSIYSTVFTILLIMGVFNLNRNLHKIRFQKGMVRFPKGTRAEIIFFNAGAILLITACVIIMAINTFSFPTT